MKYLIVSDIHGGNEAADFIKNKFATGEFNKIIILGDVLYHGPRNLLADDYNPKKVIDVLNSLKEHIICIRGNCDAEVDEMVLDFKFHKYCRLLCKKAIFLTHGHYINAFYPKEDLPAGTYVIHGHTHIIGVQTIMGVTYVNLGSISLPKEGTPKCYGILDSNGISIYDLNDKLFLEIDF